MFEHGTHGSGIRDTGFTVYPDFQRIRVHKSLGIAPARLSGMNAIDHMNVGETQMLFRANVPQETFGTTINRVTSAPSRIFRAMTDPFRRVVESFDASMNLQNDEY